MILTGKRGASSPAEAEKKKPDGKTTPSGGYVGRDAANKGYQPPMVAMEDWDGIEDTGDPWQEQSPTRRRRWSTGRSPGGTPPNQSTHQAEHSAKQEDRVLEDILTLIKASHLDQTQTSCISTRIHVSG